MVSLYMTLNLGRGMDMGMNLICNHRDMTLYSLSEHFQSIKVGGGGGS